MKHIKTAAAKTLLLEEIEAFKDRAKTIIGKAAPKVEAEETEQKTLLDV